MFLFKKKEAIVLRQPLLEILVFIYYQSKPIFTNLTILR